MQNFPRARHPRQSHCETPTLSLRGRYLGTDTLLQCNDQNGDEREFISRLTQVCQIAEEPAFATALAGSPNVDSLCFFARGVRCRLSVPEP